MCVLDFGFSQSSFSGIEQGEYYRLQVKFFSGGIGDGFIFHLSVDLSGTTSKHHNYFKVTLFVWSTVTIPGFMYYILVSTRLAKVMRGMQVYNKSM